MTYNFLILSLLFSIPGAVVLVVRPDLRGVIGRMSLCALPFAATEFLFYPDYWAPKFLFNLIDVLGFGIEDVLFVVGLAAFTSTGYAWVFCKAYVPSNEGNALRRAGLVLLGVFVLVTVVALVGVPMIYGSVVIMLGMSGLICAVRRDLALPCLLGGLVSLVVYTGLCLAFSAILPGVFELTWNTDQFLNLFVLGIPVEELIYGFAAGVSATGFYPFVWGRAFTPR